MGSLALVVAAFAIVAWLCRPRPARQRAASPVEQHLAELTTTASVAEANELAARLRRAGIVAVANATPLPAAETPRGYYVTGGHRPYVAVLAAELERARTWLYAQHRPEGDASPADIAAALAVDPDADADAAAGGNDDFESARRDDEAELDGDGVESVDRDLTPTQRRLERSGKVVVRVALVLLAATVAVGVWRVLTR